MDEYFYDLSKNLLEDRGNVSTTGGQAAWRRSWCPRRDRHDSKLRTGAVMREMIAIVVAHLLLGCAHVSKAMEYRGTPVITASEPSYDGQKIGVRVVVEAKGGPVVFDGRLIENVTIYLRDVRACDTGTTMRGYVIEDYFPSEPTEKDLITLNPYYFYGTNLEYMVFKEPGPDCIDVTLTFHSGVQPMTAKGEAMVAVRFQRNPAQPEQEPARPAP